MRMDRIELSFKQRVTPVCEFMMYDMDHSITHYTRCNEDAKIYCSERGMSIIQGGVVEKRAKKKIRLCEEHYKELKRLVPDLEEVNSERHIS